MRREFNLNEGKKNEKSPYYHRTTGNSELQ